MKCVIQQRETHLRTLQLALLQETNLVSDGKKKEQVDRAERYAAINVRVLHHIELSIEG